MAERRVAQLFWNGRSQAVRLPQEFRFPGDRVRIRRVGQGVLLEPMTPDVGAWFAAMDEWGAASLLPEVRDQPPTPTRAIELA